MLTLAGTLLVWPSIFFLNEKQKTKNEDRLWLEEGRVIVHLTGDPRFPKRKISYKRPSKQPPAPNYDIAQVSTWRRQIKLWVHACYKNETESFSFQAPLLSGYGWLPWMLQRGEEPHLWLVWMQQNCPSVFAWFVDWGGDPWSCSDCLSIGGSQMLGEEVFS